MVQYSDDALPRRDQDFVLMDAPLTLAQMLG